MDIVYQIALFSFEFMILEDRAQSSRDEFEADDAFDEKAEMAEIMDQLAKKSDAGFIVFNSFHFVI